MQTLINIVEIPKKKDAVQNLAPYVGNSIRTKHIHL